MPLIEWLRALPLDVLMRIGMAVVCGSLIGIERQIKRKAAGMRTNVMICLGAMLYVTAADLISQSAGAMSFDPSRVAGQVVVGMGFIGAGAIIQSRGQVHGLTSAATLWVVAAIGVLIGIGHPLLALGVTILVVALLVGVGKLEFLLLGKCKMVKTSISFRDDAATWSRIRTVLESHGRKIEELPVTRHETEQGETVCFMELNYCYIHPDHVEVLVELMRLPNVRQTTFDPART